MFASDQHRNRVGKGGCGVKNTSSQVQSPNLLPLSRINARRRDTATRNWILALVSIVVLVVMPAIAISINFRTAKPSDTGHVTRFVNDLQQLQSSLPSLKKELITLQTQAESQLRAQTRIQWTNVLTHLAATAPSHVRIHSFNAAIIENEGGQRIELSIQVYTGSLSQAREFLVILESSGVFDEVNMLDSRRTSTGEDALVNSTIRAIIKAEKTPEQKP